MVLRVREHGPRGDGLQGGGVLEGLAGALGEVLQHRVRGVAGQGDVAVHPVLDRDTVEHGPALHVAEVVERRPDLRHAVPVGLAQLGVALVDELTGGEGRRAVDGHGVEQLPLAQRVLHEVALGAHPHDHGLHVPGVGDLRDRQRAAVGHVLGADGLVVGELRADHGPDPVRGDDRVRLEDPAVVGGRPGHGAPVDLHVLGLRDPDVVVQGHAELGALLHEQAVQVRAVGHDVGGAVALVVLAGDVLPEQLLAREGVAEDDVPGGHAGLDGPVEHPPLAQQAGGVGGHLQAGADLPELGGLLHELDLRAEPAQGEGVAEAADAASDDEDLGVLCHGGDSFRAVRDVVRQPAGSVRPGAPGGPW